MTASRTAKARSVMLRNAAERRARYFTLRRQGVDRLAAAAAVGVSKPSTYQWEPTEKKSMRGAYMAARQDGLTRREAAEAAGCSMSSTYNWEPGDQTRPRWEVAVRLRQERLAALFEDFCWLMSTGEPVERAAERVGIAVSTAESWRKRWEASNA